MESLEDGTIELLAKVRQFSHLDENVHGTPFWYSSLSFPHLKLLNEHNTASTSHDMHMPCHFIGFSTCSVCTFYKPWPTIWQCEDFKLKLLFYHTLAVLHFTVLMKSELLQCFIHFIELNRYNCFICIQKHDSFKSCPCSSSFCHSMNEI